MRSKFHEIHVMFIKSIQTFKYFWSCINIIKTDVDDTKCVPNVIGNFLNIQYNYDFRKMFRLNDE